MPATYEPMQPCTIYMPDGTYYQAHIIKRNGNNIMQWIIELDQPTTEAQALPIGKTHERGNTGRINE